MKTSFFKYLFLIAVILSSCQKKESPSCKPKVIVTIPSYIFFVERIAKQTVDIKTLIPISKDPHIFEPNFEQVKMVFDSDVWFKSGEPFEKPLLDLLKNYNRKIEIVDLRDQIPLISNELFQDRHVWLSPILVKIQAKNIANTLIKKFPMNREYYEKNLETLLKDLNSLNDTIIEKLSSLKRRSFLISHPSYGYLCRDYHLEQIPIEEEGKEPSTKGLKIILERAKQRGVKTVFIQNQYDNRAAKIIAKKLNLKIKQIDPYSPKYFENMMDFIDAL